jgi:hypothetical protein
MRWHGIVMRICGGLVVLAGVLHLVMTGHLMHWFRMVSHNALPGTAYAAMLLNHLVVGVLLVPVGVSLFLAASQRERHVLGIAVANALALLALPGILILTATADMLQAPVFVVAATLLVAAAVLNLFAIAAALRDTQALR